VSTDNPPAGSLDDDQAATRAARVADYRQSFDIAADAITDAIRTGVGDGGELICHLVATVAANLGSVDAITAARPGSWEADLVHQILTSTVGPGDLLRWRTAPIEIVENVEMLLFGLDLGEALYDASLEQIWAALETAGHGMATGVANMRQLTVEGEALYDAAIEPIQALQAEDFARYVDSFTIAVRVVVEQLVKDEGLAPDVAVSVRFVDYRAGDEDGNGEPLTADLDGARYEAQYGPLTDAPLEVRVWQAARALVPPPGFTAPLKDLEAGGNLVDQLVAAGRLPHQRIPELAHYPANPTILRQMAGGTGGVADEGATS
jgi:hypothetical protein